MLLPRSLLAPQAKRAGVPAAHHNFLFAICGFSLYRLSASPVTRFLTPEMCWSYTGGGVCPMTPKQILHSFSDTLMHDERILSARERELVANLLRHAESAADEHSDNQRSEAAMTA